MGNGNRGGKRASGGNNSVPKMNNPAGIPSNHMTEDEFLALKGVGSAVSGSGVDMIGGANMHYLSNKQRQKVLSNIQSQSDAYYAKRQEARAEYQKLVSQGKIVPKTPLEKRITTAHGNPDLSSTQAARRMVRKLGYDWRTGKKLKGVNN